MKWERNTIKGETLFKKILAPTDGSIQSQRAIEKAAVIAKQYNAKLTILHVVPLSEKVSPVGPLALKEVIQELKDEAEKYVTKGKEIASKVGVTADAKIINGDPAEVIVKEAEEGGYDLIIMGSRRLSKIARFALGSVSSKVVRNAQCPVMVDR